MRGSKKILEAFGIGIYVHWTFAILIAWIVYVYVSRGAGPLEVLEGIGFIVALFACIVLHELGHALTARRFGIQTRDITLLPIGGMARLERMPEDPKQELLVALGGPAVTLAIAGGLLAVVLAAWGPAALLDQQLVGGNFLAKLMWVNAFLLAFNLIPAFPMDGGRVLRAALHFGLDYVQATQIAAATGQVLAVLFVIGGLLVANPFLALIGVFVYFGAKEEARSARVRDLCEGIPVQHAMVTNFRAFEPETTLEDAVRALLTGSQKDFPVVRDHHVIGMVRHRDLIHAIEAGNTTATVESIMHTDCPPVDEREMLQGTFQRMRTSGCSTVPVVHDDQLVGIVTLENVGEWMLIQSAARAAKARHRVEDIFREP